MPNIPPIERRQRIDRRRAGRRARKIMVKPASTETIAERLGAAITEHRLPPGTRLVEESLGDVFGVSRTKVRQALFQLARAKLVTIATGRGACVARPGVQEAREIFEARRVIERALAWRFTQVASEAQITRLREHVGREREALEAGDSGTGTRLSGEFHLLIAEMSGNSVLAELLRELVSRTSLIIVLYGSTLPASCSADEHEELLAKIENRDAEGALRLMAHHLDHIERGLNLREEEQPTVDLRTALAEK
jgi:DNA-binding GntR family transcriptional regulator